MNHLRALNPFIWRYKNRFMLGIVFIIAANIFAVLSPQVIRYAIDLLSGSMATYKLLAGMPFQSSLYTNFQLALLLFAGVYLALALFKGIFTFYMRQTIIVVSRLVETDLRNAVYGHYQELDQQFYKANNTGDLMSRVTEDIIRVRMYLGPAIMYSINLIVLVIMVVSVMLTVNAELTMYVLLPLPILSVSIYYVNTLINKRSEAIQRQLSKLTSIAQETYSGIRLVKSYVQERPLTKFFGDESDVYKKKALDLVRVESFFFPLMLLLIGLSTILTIYIGGLAVMRGSITPGNIAEFVIYINMLTWPVTAIGWVASIIQRAAASQKRLNEFMEQTPVIASPPQSAELKLNATIKFKDVSFTYPDTGIEALKNIDLEVKSGQKVAVIGRVGSGKSTLAHLMLRLHDPTSGSIKIGDTNIKDVDLGKLRQHMGFVPQDQFLFSDTVAHNIAFGKPEASRSDIERAADNAGMAAEIADMPNGYEAVLGERGITISGGQKQRLNIARALVKEPEIIVFDDCLSAVDANTEQKILDHLETYLADKTAIIITHRIHSLLHFDKIIVLDQGSIAEEGTHEELMSKEGLYYALYERQKLQEADLGS